MCASAKQNVWKSDEFDAKWVYGSPTRGYRDNTRHIWLRDLDE